MNEITRRNRLVLVSAVVVAALVAAGAFLLLRDGGGDGGDSIPTPSPRGQVATPAVAQTAPTSPSPAAPVLALSGDSLGVTRIGDPQRVAVQAITAALGASTPTDAVSCPGSEVEVHWKAFGLSFTAGKLDGWYSTDPSLTTPSGVTVGTKVARLKEIYKTRFQLGSPQADTGWQFVATGVNQAGNLTGGTDADTVTGFVNGSCAGP